VRADIAKARLIIDQCRLLCMQAAREIGLKKKIKKKRK
jgi:hypothetical protein